MGSERTDLLEEFQRLSARAAQLSEDEAQRLELLRDLLLELAAESKAPEGAVRSARVASEFEASFGDATSFSAAYAKNLGVGGIALRTERPPSVGASIRLRLSLPDGGPPAEVSGRVTWQSADAFGVEFVDAGAAAQRRFKDILLKDASLTQRLKRVLATDVRALGKSPEVLPAPATEVDARPAVLVQLSDPALNRVTLELLREQGVRAVTAKDGLRLSIAVVDTGTAVATAAVCSSARLIFVNASGPDALTGKAAALDPAVFIKRPASAAAIATAVARLLR